MHRLYLTNLYRRWQGIIGRCYNRRHKAYGDYGGRGVTMWEEWKERPEVFIEYIKSLPGSDDPNLTLDRINNNGNYEPGNLQWATQKQQCRNKRNNITAQQIEDIKYKLKNSCLSRRKIAKLVGVSSSSVYLISKELHV